MPETLAFAPPSLLFADGAPAPEADAPPPCFGDLNLAPVVHAATAGREELNLAPFYYAPLRLAAAIAYRQAVVRDLESPPWRAAAAGFCAAMRAMRRRRERERQLAAYPYARQRQWLAAAAGYVDAVEALALALARTPPVSPALRGVAAYLAGTVAGEAFRRLREEARGVQAQLDAVGFELLFRDGTITVRAAQSEEDLSAEVEAAFQRFQAAGEPVAVPTPRWEGMNHIEAQIQQKLARLFPAPFRALEEFCAGHADFVDPAVARLERELGFYLGFIEFCERLELDGLRFCVPEMAEGRELHATGAFDLALAETLDRRRKEIVRNDFDLRGAERIFVVTGPNHGGKTTFARLIGQLHYLASLGLPVPAASARLPVVDAIFTHFERAESVATLRGKLEDDLVRMRGILDAAGPRSLLIVNEVFAATTLEDALLLSRRVLEQVSALDAVAVWVTFLDALARFDAKTVSLVAGVDPDDPSRRTFRLERRPADGLAYAWAIARKHGLTPEQLRRRLPQ